MGMNTNYHINLSHEYEYKCRCSEISTHIFDTALKQKHYPSRFSLIANLLKEVLCSSLYFIRKTTEIGLYTLNLMTAKKNVHHSAFRALRLTDYVSLVSLQILIPILGTTIRVSATVAGLLSPSYALRGWKLAEGGEAYAYLLWTQYFDCTHIPPHHQAQAHEEIDPHNAIFYLGRQDAYYLAHANIVKDHGHLEDQISQKLGSLLYEIFRAHPDYFRQLFNHTSAPNKKNKMCHFISPDTKEILNNLRRKLKDEELEENRIDSRLLVEIPALPAKDNRRIFEHISLNLQHSLLENELNLNGQLTESIEEHMMLLKDLFSQRFDFGRAHFPQSMHSFGLYTRV